MLRFDPERCTGCQACRMACMDQRDIRPLAGQPPLCRVEPAERDNTIYYRFVGCVHCGACAAVCPAGCLEISPEGLVLAAKERCAGCGACADACPLGVIAFDLADGTVIKCDGCEGRRAAGLLPACVHTCPAGALNWED